MAAAFAALRCAKPCASDGYYNWLEILLWAKLTLWTTEVARLHLKVKFRGLTVVFHFPRERGERTALQRRTQDSCGQPESLWGVWGCQGPSSRKRTNTRNWAALNEKILTDSKCTFFFPTTEIYKGGKRHTCSKTPKWRWKGDFFFLKTFSVERDRISSCSFRLWLAACWWFPAGSRNRETRTGSKV